jgi:cytochrome P450
MGRPEVDFDQYSEKFAAAPWQELAAIRSRCPVAWVPRYGGFWLASSYEGVAAAAKDDVVFSSRHDEPFETATYGGLAIPSAPNRIGWMEFDPPTFLYYRRLLAPWFSPRRAEAMADDVRRDVTTLLGARRHLGSIDFIDDLAIPVTGRVIMETLGIDPDAWVDLVLPMHDFFHNSPGSPEFLDAVQRMAVGEERIAELTASRRANPGDDLISYCCTHPLEDGHFLDDAEIASVCSLIIGGGTDTVPSVFGSTVNWLAQHEDARRRLRDDPSLVPLACEELLRYFTPQMALARTVSEDTELCGQPLNECDRLLLHWGGANHDPSEFAGPEELRLDRQPNRHAAFGIGAHRCIGSNVARMEFRTLVEAVVTLLPEFTVKPVEPYRYPSVALNYGYLHVYATFPDSEEPVR